VDALSEGAIIIRMLKDYVAMRDQTRSDAGMRVRTENEPRAQMRVNPPAESLRQNLGSPDRQGSDNHPIGV
jgi:hypothetical protein